MAQPPRGESADVEVNQGQGKVQLPPGEFTGAGISP
jgi:hypothetical protein